MPHNSCPPPPPKCDNGPATRALAGIEKELRVVEESLGYERQRNRLVEWCVQTEWGVPGRAMAIRFGLDHFYSQGCRTGTGAGDLTGVPPDSSEVAKTWKVKFDESR